MDKECLVPRESPAGRDSDAWRERSLEWSAGHTEGKSRTLTCQDKSSQEQQWRARHGDREYSTPMA